MHVFARAILLDLPIRDGNTNRDSRRRFITTLLDLPIRDGNMVIFKAPRSEQTTFRPSYQGWKPRVHEPQVQPWMPFRPSYQGWKHELLIAHHVQNILLDLPIRDGNSRSLN